MSVSAFLGFLAVTWAALLVAVVSGRCLYLGMFADPGPGATRLDRALWLTGQGLVLLALLLMSGALAGGVAFAVMKAFAP